MQVQHVMLGLQLICGSLHVQCCACPICCALMYAQYKLTYMLTCLIVLTPKVLAQDVSQLGQKHQTAVQCLLWAHYRRMSSASTIVTVFAVQWQ